MSTKDMYEKDYYKILGVPKDADAATIKKAYRKLAKDLHPDANAGDKKIEEKFKAVSEAYDVVSDPKRRAEYDEAQRYGGPMGGGRRGPGGPGGPHHASGHGLSQRPGSGPALPAHSGGTGGPATRQHRLRPHIHAQAHRPAPGRQHPGLPVPRRTGDAGAAGRGLPAPVDGARDRALGSDAGRGPGPARARLA